jgi:hypothetical protein
VAKTPSKIGTRAMPATDQRRDSQTDSTNVLRDPFLGRTTDGRRTTSQRPLLRDSEDNPLVTRQRRVAVVGDLQYDVKCPARLVGYNEAGVLFEIVIERGVQIDVSLDPIFASPLVAFPNPLGPSNSVPKKM